MVGGIYAEKEVNPGFWSITFLITPILNTILAIKFCNITMKGYKKFIKELK